MRLHTGVAAEKRRLQCHIPPVAQEEGVAPCTGRASSIFLPEPNWSAQSPRQRLTKRPPPHSAPGASPPAPTLLIKKFC